MAEPNTPFKHDIKLSYQSNHLAQGHYQIKLIGATKLIWKFSTFDWLPNFKWLFKLIEMIEIGIGIWYAEFFL